MMNLKLFTLFIVLSLLFINFVNGGCLKAKQLTNATNQHTKMVAALRMTSNSKTIISIGTAGDLKVWSLVNTNLILKQSWDLNQQFIQNTLFLWNDGVKIITGGSSKYVKIYTFNTSSGLYDTVNYENISVGIPNNYTYIYSIFVNKLANQMYIGINQYDQGLKRFVYDGKKWNENTPSSLTNEIVEGRWVNHVTLTKDQTKLIVAYYSSAGYMQSNRFVKIFNINGENYSINQTIRTSYSNDGGCKTSQDNNFISCYGYEEQFNNYMFDTAKNQYLNVSAPFQQATQTLAAFMDANKVYTMIDKFYIYQYKFSYQNQSPAYVLSEKVGLGPNNSSPRIIIPQAQSKFYIVGTAYYNPQTAQYGGRLYFVSCYQFSQQQSTEQNKKSNTRKHLTYIKQRIISL